MHLPQFSGSQKTTEFIRLVDRMFDICNSKNVSGKGYKTPLTSINLQVGLSLTSDSDINILANLYPCIAVYCNILICLHVFIFSSNVCRNCNEQEEMTEFTKLYMSNQDFL